MTTAAALQDLRLQTDGPDLADGVWELSLARPERRNAFSVRTLDELCEVLDRGERDPDCRALVLLADGPSYCAGADLTSFAGEPVNLGEHPVWDRLWMSTLPVVTGVQGHAVTGGLLLALSCDLLVATPQTQVGDSHAQLGLIPTGAEAQKFQRRLGQAAARLAMLAGVRLDGSDLLRLGVAVDVVAPGDLRSRCLSLAAGVASGSPRSVSVMKQMLNRGAHLDYHTAVAADHVQADWGRANFAPDPERERRLAARGVAS